MLKNTYSKASHEHALCVYSFVLNVSMLVQETASTLSAQPVDVPVLRATAYKAREDARTIYRTVYEMRYKLVRGERYINQLRSTKGQIP